jgi:hypothetical protein
MRQRLIVVPWLAVVGSLAVAAGVGVWAVASHLAASPAAVAEAGRDCAAMAGEFTDYPLVFAGTQVDALPLSGCQRVVTPEKYNLGGSVREPRMDYFVFTYGSCVSVEEEGGCPPPVQILVDPPCAPALGGAAIKDRSTVRGLNVAVKTDGSLRIEAAGFKATIYALAGSYEANKQMAMGVVLALRGANDRASALGVGTRLDVPLGGNTVCE